MKIVIVVPPKDFRDETLSNAELYLDKKGIEHQLASFSKKECMGSHGAVRKQDLSADTMEPADYAAILLLDGQGVDEFRLFEHRPLLDRVKGFYDSKKLIGGIGNALKIIAKANIVKETKLAGIDDEEASRLVRLYKGVPSDDAVVLDKNIITAADNSQLFEFINKFAEQLGAV